MELILNIATLLTEDLMNDVNEMQSKNLKQNLESDGCSSYPPLLELDSEDDELFTFYARQRSIHPLKRTKPAGHKNLKHKVPRNTRNAPAEVEIPASSAVVCEEPVLEVNLLNDFNNTLFENNLHMSKATFLKIFQSLRHLLVGNRNPDVSPQTVFSIALWKLATDEHFEEISRRFRIRLQCCNLVIRKFWHLLSENYESFIKWPNSKKSQHTTLNDFQTVPALKSFKNLFGIISARRLDIFLESEDEEVSVTLQIVCNAKEKIIDCFVELSNEYSFENTPIGQTLDLNAEAMPAGCYVIGDSSFPLKSFLMRPFEIACFRNETIFNSMLQPALTIGQHVLDTMAQRFHTLYALEAKNMSEVRKVLETVCSLHNLCVEHNDCYVVRMQENRATAQPLSTTLKGAEQNPQGRTIRMQLMDSIVH